MKWSKEDYFAAFERRVVGRSENEAASLRAIVAANWSKDRVDKWRERQPTATLDDYHEEILAQFDTWHETVVGLKQHGSSELWQIYRQKLFVWVYRRVQSEKFVLRSNESPHEVAEEGANEAAVGIWRAEYNYQVDFERWCHRIANNVCSRMVRERVTLKRKQDIETAPLDDLEEVLFAPTNDQNLSQRLAWGLDQLSYHQRAIVYLRYFAKLQVKEIAVLLERTDNWVSKEHRKAIVRLQQIFGEDDHKK